MRSFVLCMFLIVFIWFWLAKWEQFRDQQRGPALDRAVTCEVARRWAKDLGLEVRTVRCDAYGRCLVATAHNILRVKCTEHVCDLVWVNDFRP